MENWKKLNFRFLNKIGIKKWELKRKWNKLRKINHAFGNTVYKKLLLLAYTKFVVFLPTSEFPSEIPR